MRLVLCGNLKLMHEIYPFIDRIFFRIRVHAHRTRLVAACLRTPRILSMMFSNYPSSCMLTRFGYKEPTTLLVHFVLWVKR